MMSISMALTSDGFDDNDSAAAVFMNGDSSSKDVEKVVKRVHYNNYNMN